MNKIEREKIIVGHMISLYCRKKHTTDILCEECELLKQYALERLNKCPFGDDKSACKVCTVHCYNKDMRIRIRKVMRFSGPRMWFYYLKDLLFHYTKKRP